MRSVLRAVLGLGLVLALLGASACDSSEAIGTVVRVRPQEAVRLLEDGGHVVIDLRTPREFEAGRVAGARNIDASADDFEERVGRLDPEASYLVYSRIKGDSAPAADTMARLGVENVVDAGAFGTLALAGADLE
jgi:rhodanese-related sulfurtransferase